jgi:hypothetical protein
MNNIVDLDSHRKIDNPVYECICGSQKFYLKMGGIIACDECDKEHIHLIWGQHFVSKLRPDLNKPEPEEKK